MLAGGGTMWGSVAVNLVPFFSFGDHAGFITENIVPFLSENAQKRFWAPPPYQLSEHAVIGSNKIFEILSFSAFWDASQLLQRSPHTFSPHIGGGRVTYIYFLLYKRIVVPRNHSDCCTK